MQNIKKGAAARWEATPNRSAPNRNPIENIGRSPFNQTAVVLANLRLKVVAHIDADSTWRLVLRHGQINCWTTGCTGLDVGVFYIADIGIHMP